ncbi:MAG: hypothetical protein SV375_04765 [Thermodesulfobacteriota bacterium]|nr:hypothetical protein [Thermodesulfobacteriota bacterium]
MKQIKNDLRALSKSLKQLKRKIEQTAKKMDKLDKVKVARARVKPVKKASGRKKVKPTAIDTVMAVINRSRKGVTTAQIKAKTGFDERKIWDTVNRAKRQGMVKSGGKGIYIKA